MYQKQLHILTGGSRGLGAALADFFAAQGHDVAEISRSGRNRGSIRHFSCDLGGAEPKEAVIAAIFQAFPLERYGRISLTNNAGMVEPVKHVPDLQEADLARNIAVNLTAPLALTAAFLKFSAGFSGERVVTNVSTGVAKRPKGSWAAYSAAKAGLECFSEALAKDFAGDGRVKVITFEPGIIDTEMQALIRGVDPADFDETERFRNFKREGQLLAPSVVGTALGKLILKPHLPPMQQISVYELIG